MLVTHIYNQVVNVATLFLFGGLSLGLNAEVDFVVFPEVNVDHVDGESFSEKNITPSFDVFVSGELGPTLVLVEAFASETVQHVERLQLGINIADSSRAWLGRHHNPFGYWHTQYHHGTFLQTSISRPALVELGGAGGIVPSHSTGALFEGELERGRAGWHYALSVGLTSQLKSDGGGHHGGTAAAALHDFDIFNPKPGDHELGYAFRLAYLPDALGENQFGSFVTHGKITLAQAQANDEEIDLDIVGVFANFQQEDIRFISELYYFSSDVTDHLGSRSGSFLATYLQAEYLTKEQWTPYVRLEDTFGNEDDPYLALLDGYPPSGQTIGVRFDFAENHAIKFEYANREFEHDTTGRWQLSWSAAWQ